MEQHQKSETLALPSFDRNDLNLGNTKLTLYNNSISYVPTGRQNEKPVVDDTSM